MGVHVLSLATHVEIECVMHGSAWPAFLELRVKFIYTL